MLWFYGNFEDCAKIKSFNWMVFALSPVIFIASKSFRTLLYLDKFFTSSRGNTFGIWMLNGQRRSFFVVLFCFVLLFCLSQLVIQHSTCWLRRVFLLCSGHNLSLLCLLKVTKTLISLTPNRSYTKKDYISFTEHQP